MHKGQLAPPPAWASAAHVAVVALSLALLLLAEVRGQFTGAALAVLYGVTVGNMVYRDWRAGLLHMTLREGGRQARSTHSARTMLETAAALLGCVAIVVVTLSR